jgi:hypothetical protein
LFIAPSGKITNALFLSSRSHIRRMARTLCADRSIGIQFIL